MACAGEWCDKDVWRAWQVRQQMDAMVSILEQADKEDAAEAAGITGGGDVFLSNDWTLSPQLSAIYDRINTAVSDLVCFPRQQPKPLHPMLACERLPHPWTQPVLPLIRLSRVIAAAFLYAWVVVLFAPRRSPRLLCALLCAPLHAIRAWA